MAKVSWWLQFGGLVLGFIGAFLLTISQQATRDSVEGRADGREVGFVLLERPGLWRLGLALVCVGFLLQATSMLLPALRV